MDEIAKAHREHLRAVRPPPEPPALRLPALAFGLGVAAGLALARLLQ